MSNPAYHSISVAISGLNTANVTLICSAKNNRKSYFIITLFLLLTFISLLKSGESFDISGKIVSEKDNAPVSGAYILLEPGGRYTESDQNGVFSFKNVPEGSYRISVEHIKYQSLDPVDIDLHPGKSVNLNFTMREILYSAADAIVITATRGEHSSQELSHSIDVVSTERITGVLPMNAGEALQDLPGTFIKNYGGLNALKTFSLRGSTAEQVLVLLDGQRLNNPQNGQVDLSTVPLDGIERIEVLRGGSSAVYGADAVGGVVNLISREKKDNIGFGGNIRLLCGSFDTKSLETNVSYDLNRFSGKIGYTRVKSAGDYNYSDINGIIQSRSNNDIYSHSLFSDMLFRLGNEPFQTKLKLNYRYYSSERGSPGPLDFATPLARQWDTNQQLQSTISGKIFGPLNDYQVDAYWNRNNYRYEDSDTLTATYTTHNSGIYGLETQFKSIFSFFNELTYGFGVRKEWMKSNIFSEDHQRTIYYLFIQDLVSIRSSVFSTPAEIHFIPALRYDHYTASGSQMSPKLGSSITVGSDFQSAFKCNVGWSFRAPTFNELYWPSTPWSSGNMDLKAEKGVDWDIGLNLRYSSLRKFAFDIVYFNTFLKDLIQWQSTDFFYRPVNIARSRNKGVEIKTSIQPIDNILTLMANYTYLDARDESANSESNGNYLVYRPGNTFNLTLNLRWDILKIIYDFRYVGKRFTDISNRTYLDPYRLSDITISLTKKIGQWKPQLLFQIRNLFDTKYEVIKYQPMPGREYRLSLGILYN